MNPAPPVDTPQPPVASLADRLDALLPQTQCTRCGEPDCRRYAEALASGRARVNQCPPGGAEGIRRLAAELGCAELPLDPAHGVEGPRSVVYVDEAACIGCTLCIQACPVDAIVGAPKRMHVVIEAACTGCELCLPACPVDCLRTEPASGRATGWNAWSPEQAQEARRRYQRRLARRSFEAPLPPSVTPASPTSPASRTPPASPASPVSPAPPAPPGTPEAAASDPKRAALEAAMARARLRAHLRTP